MLEIGNQVTLKLDFIAAFELNIRPGELGIIERIVPIGMDIYNGGVLYSYYTKFKNAAVQIRECDIETLQTQNTQMLLFWWNLLKYIIVCDDIQIYNWIIWFDYGAHVDYS